MKSLLHNITQKVEDIMATENNDASQELNISPTSLSRKRIILRYIIMIPYLSSKSLTPLITRIIP